MRSCINIAGRKIGSGYPVFIIAEAGVNHNGSLKLAKKMVDSAKSSNADAIKFQTFKTENLMIKDNAAKSQFNMLKHLELNEKEFKILNDYCKKKGIMFLSTPFDSESAYFLYRLGVPAFKIASGELTNAPLLLQIANYQRPVILSTGMATLNEVREAVKTIYSTGNRKLALLHCTSNYPARYEDVNLKAMNVLSQNFGVPVGYSDHTQGIEVSVAAVTMASCIIEKHFTLDKALKGADHRISLEPDEFRNLARAIRNTEKAMGNGVKAPRDSEENTKKLARKSIAASCDIPKGTKLKLNMLSVKRPGKGIEPRYLNGLIDKISKVNIKKENIITWNMLREKW